jgi:hypothetical protein
MNAADLAQRVAVPAERGRSRQHNVWTLAAIGFLAYYVTVMWHEVLGHGSVMYLTGVRDFILTSTSMFPQHIQSTEGHVSLAARLVVLGGPVSNTLLGLLLYPLSRSLTRSKANLTVRYLLWLLTALNFFLGFAYMVFSGIFGVGDFAVAIAFLPYHALLRRLEVVVGILLCVGTVRFFAVSFAEFPEDLWRLALVPYISATIVFCAAGLRNPAGAYIMMASVVPAALMGQGILPFVTPVARKLRIASPPSQAIPASPAAILVALVFVVIIFLTAPGVRFTLP